jgi:hypothetical protein
LKPDISLNHILAYAHSINPAFASANRRSLRSKLLTYFASQLFVEARYLFQSHTYVCSFFRFALRLDLASLVAFKISAALRCSFKARRV